MDSDVKTRTRPVAPRAAKVDAIEQAARSLFEVRGYGAVSMDEIARVAGVSKATIYSHFADKEALFESMMREGCSLAWVRTELVERPVGDVRATLAEIGRAYLEALTGHVTVFRIVIAEALRFPELASMFFENGPHASNQALAAYFRRACDEGKLDIDDPARAAIHFFSLLRDDTYLKILLGLPTPDRDAKLMVTVQTAIDTFMRLHEVK